MTQRGTSDASPVRIIDISPSCGETSCDCVTSAGKVWRYEWGKGWTDLTKGVSDFVALKTSFYRDRQEPQPSVSYTLDTQGRIWHRNTTTGRWRRQDDAITAGPYSDIASFVRERARRTGVWAIHRDDMKPRLVFFKPVPRVVQDSGWPRLRYIASLDTPDYGGAIGLDRSSNPWIYNERGTEWDWRPMAKTQMNAIAEARGRIFGLVGTDELKVPSGDGWRHFMGTPGPCLQLGGEGNALWVCETDGQALWRRLPNQRWAKPVKHAPS